jgi:transcriptional regulator with XRE-family HTH domain
MAHELNTSPAAYRKIELNQTKLTVERPFQIAQILDAKVENLLDLKAETEFKQTNTDSATGYQQQIEHFYAENKETNDRFIKSLQEEIVFLREQLKKTIRKFINLSLRIVYENNFKTIVSLV